MVRNALREEIMKMSVADRILLAQELWESIADEPNACELTPEQERELDRRFKALRQRLESGGDTSTSWAEAKHRIRKK